MQAYSSFIGISNTRDGEKEYSRALSEIYSVYCKEKGQVKVRSLRGITMRSGKGFLNWVISQYDTMDIINGSVCREVEQSEKSGVKALNLW